MAIVYNNLWKLLIDAGIKKTELRNIAGISTATLAKLSANETVSLGVIERICAALNVQPGDILEYKAPRPSKTEGSKVLLPPPIRTVSLRMWRIKK